MCAAIMYVILQIYFPKVYKYYCVLERNYSDEEFPESEQIQKQFEICSYDEYDDFKPRHPLPKVEWLSPNYIHITINQLPLLHIDLFHSVQNHRRGNSYFNSDVEAYANDAIVGFDMSNIAAAATALSKIHFSITFYFTK